MPLSELVEKWTGLDFDIAAEEMRRLQVAVFLLLLIQPIFSPNLLNKRNYNYTASTSKQFTETFLHLINIVIITPCIKLNKS